MIASFCEENFWNHIMDTVANGDKYQCKSEYFPKYWTHTPLCELWRLLPPYDAPCWGYSPIHIKRSGTKEEKSRKYYVSLSLPEAEEIGFIPTLYQMIYVFFVERKDLHLISI